MANRENLFAVEIQLFLSRSQGVKEMADYHRVTDNMMLLQ